MFHKHVSPHKASANVIDGTLIVSFPNAVNPSVWRIDLTQVNIGGVEVREEEGAFIIGARNAKGELNDVATYPTRESATQALTAITEAMLNAPPIRAAAPAGVAAAAGAVPSAPVAAAAMQQRGFVSRWARRLGTLVGVAAVLFAIAVFASGYFSNGSSANGDRAGSGSYPRNTQSLGEIDPGVPMSADDLLGGG